MLYFKFTGNQNRIWTILFFAILLSSFIGCQPKNIVSLNMGNYFAWCIVPFDSLDRTPEERIEMLSSLGFTSYAYDWRTKHLPKMAREIQLAKENNIRINAIWMWIDVADTLGNLSDDNERVFNIIEESGIHTQLWIGISEAYFEGLNEEESLQKSKEIIRYLSERASNLGCNIGLYNHGGWFGNPAKQVELIKALPDLELGIIFNFHHAHELLDSFPELVELMVPYLWAVNLNGMKADGPKILPIGSGDQELEMILLLEEKGFHGPYGILGHVEEADVKMVLQQNIEGLKNIL